MIKVYDFWFLVNLGHSTNKFGRNEAQPKLTIEVLQIALGTYEFT